VKVQPCPACGARYNVERLSDGVTFECRRCGHAVHVGAHEPPPRPQSAGLVLAGLAMLLGLLLYANPRFGFGQSRWPWELLQGDAALSTKVTVLLWAGAGLWAAISALGIAPRSRSVLSVGLAFVLILACTRSGIGELGIDTDLVALVAMIALAAGLFLLRDAGTVPLARTLAFGAGLLVTWVFVFSFQEATPTMRALVDDVRGVFDGRLGSDEVTQVLVPRLALLLAGLVGVGAGLGIGGRGWVGTGLTLLLITLLLPALSELVGRLGEDDPWGDVGRIVAEHGTAALVTSGLAPWLLASQGIADLARNRKDTAS
jgi:hypothetical protein